MSKFIDAVRTVLVQGNDRAVPEPIRDFLKVDSEFQTSPIDRMHRYQIGVSFVWCGHCRPAEVHVIHDNLVSELRDLVYGELRNRLLRLERSIYEHKLDDAKAELRDIHREISGH